MITYIRTKPLPHCRTCHKPMGYYVPGLSDSEHEHPECAGERAAKESLDRVFKKHFPYQPKTAKESDKAMTNEEVNQYIHETIMGKCLHEYAEPKVRQIMAKCSKCDGLYEPTPPDYTSDNSPRSLLNEVCTKIIGIYQADDGDGLPAYFYLNQKTPAEIIARACVNAHQEQSK